MAPPVLFAFRKLPGVDLGSLSDCYEVRGGGTPVPRSELAAAARGAIALLPTYLDPVDEPLLQALPSVRLVASYGVGVNHVDLAACRRRGVVVTNTPGVLTEATADHAMALLLAAARRVAEGDRTIRRGGWTTLDPGWHLGTDLGGKTLGIVGSGRIGQAVARRASAFGLVVAHAEWSRAPDVSGRVLPLEELLAEALASGRLAAAGLDVFPDEPRVPPAYLALENVVLTPHLGSGTRETRAAMSRLVLEEARRFARGEPPRNPV
jgi:glyoxylate reductase